MMNTQKVDLFDSAMTYLADAGLRITYMSRAAGVDPGGDGVVRVVTPSGATQLYEVQIKNQISPSTAAGIRPAKEGRVLILSSYVTDSVAEYWRGMDIHYIDSVGNMYLRLEGIAVDIRGRKPLPTLPGDRGKPLRVFRATGLRVLFNLLISPDLINRSYREIAELGGVSLGTVHWVLKELEQLGFIFPGTHGRRLYRTGDLLNRWVDAYTLDLAPRLLLAQFDAPNPSWWKEADAFLSAESGQWGGETAAYLLTHQMQPSRAIIYAPRVPVEAAARYRFVKARDEGNVEVRKRFWPGAENTTVPTPLIYADLIASSDPRQLQAAAYLREHDELLRRLDRG